MSIAMRCLSSAGLLIVGLSLSSCMLTPNNGDSIGVRSTPIRFEGFDVLPGATISIEAHDGQDWKTIGTTVTSTNRLGDGYYHFVVNLTVPDGYWTRELASERYRASLRATSSGGHQLLTYEPGGFDFLDPLGSTSPDSPVVTLVSEFRALLSAPEREVLDLTNRARTDPTGFAQDYASRLDSAAYAELMSLGGRPALKLHPDLIAAAQSHSSDLATCDPRESTHESCDGKPFHVRIRDFFNGAGAAENVFYYPNGSPLDLVTGWLNSAGHRNHMLSSTFDYIGVGADGAYWTQTFGS